MEKIIIICAAALLAAGCSGEKPEAKPGTMKVELKAVPPESYLSPSTRAYLPGPANGWYNTEIYLASYKEDPGNGVPAFPGTYGRILRGVVNESMTMFDPPLFYPTDGNDKVYLRGFYPRRSCTSIPEGFAGTDYDISGMNNLLRYTLTGKEDLMISNAVSGSMTAPLSGQSTAGQLHFQHLLTQLSFTLKAAAEGFPRTLAVKAIRVWNVHKQAVLDLDNANQSDLGSILDWEDDGEDVSGNSFEAYMNAAGLEITTEQSSNLGHVMMRPNERFRIEIEFIDGTKAEVRNITDVDGGGDISNPDMGTGTARATAYQINLTFASENSLPDVSAAWTDVRLDDPAAGGNWW